MVSYCRQPPREAFNMQVVQGAVTTTRRTRKIAGGPYAEHQRQKDMTLLLV